MRKYAQPRKSLPARRDAELSLRLQKLQDAVATLQGDLQLAVEEGLIPPGWTVDQSERTQLVIERCGLGNLDARATCGSDSAERQIRISVEVIPVITFTLSIPEDWDYIEPTSETRGSITANSTGMGTIDIFADNGGGYADVRTIDLVVDVEP